MTSQNLASTRVALTTTRQDLFHTTKVKEERGFLIDEHVKTENILLDEAQQVIAAAATAVVIVVVVVVVVVVVDDDNDNVCLFVCLFVCFTIVSTAADECG